MFDIVYDVRYWENGTCIKGRTFVVHIFHIMSNLVKKSERNFQLKKKLRGKIIPTGSIPGF